MAEISGLFNSVDGEPEYNDVAMANMFSLLTGGAGYVVGQKNELEVSNDGLNISVDSGAAWIGNPAGYWYINDEEKIIALDPCEAGKTRIDRIVLYLNKTPAVPTIEAGVISGIATEGTPDPADLTPPPEQDVFYLSLAQVCVDDTTITQVIDERNSSLCGCVNLSNKHVITAANGNTHEAYPIGISYSDIGVTNYIQSGQVDNTAFPEENMSIQTLNIRKARFYQYAHINDGSSLYYRSSYNGVWQPWRRLDSGDVLKTSSFTLALTEMNCFVRCSSTSDITVTIPTNDEVPFPLNTDITIFRNNTGEVNISPATDVALGSVDSNRKIDGQYAAATLRKVAENTWYLIGQLTS